MMKAAARMELLPMENGCLRKFFTTARSYSSLWGEEILGQHPQEWI